MSLRRHILSVLLCLGPLSCTSTAQQEYTSADTGIRAKNIKLEVFANQTSIQISGVHLSISADGNHLQVYEDASMVSKGTTPFTASADQIKVELTEQKVALLGHVKANFNLNLPHVQEAIE